MLRIRFHGRGGQGMKTASRMLGNALFLAGYEVQDAPRYGAERRGAPIFAYVRADKDPINERGIITKPDLVIVADPSLLGVPAAGATQGINEHTVLLIAGDTSAEQWQQRLNIHCRIYTFTVAEPALVGAACVGAAARMLGVLSVEHLGNAISAELAGIGGAVLQHNLAQAMASFEAFASQEGSVEPGLPLHVDSHAHTDWITLDNESVSYAAPAIHRSANSVEVRTGLWRTLRPVIDYDLCKRCNWVCSNFCPDNAIQVADDGRPEIDLDHCKGCMICVAQCPPHAIETVAESVAREQEESGR